MNFLGRCEGDCDFVLFATPEDIRSIETFRDIKPGTAGRRPEGTVFGRCPTNHKVFRLKRVQGTYSAVHKCDSRCLNAKGHSCTCSCGGVNHGRGHAGAVVQARAAASSVHLGEVGKHIRGTAMVIAVREIESEWGASVLYHFTTEKGSIVKWFAPSYADPHYELGQSVTFRAKVKSHQEYQGEARTVVTYFEETENV